MELGRQLLAVLLVLGLLAAALWWLRQKSGLRIAGVSIRRSGRRRHVVLVERVSLTPQHALHLIHVADRALLVSTGPTGCSILEGLAWKEVQAGQEESGSGPVEG